MRSREIFLLPFGFEVVTAEFLDYTFHREKAAAFVHADSFISPIRLFHVSWGMESSVATSNDKTPLNDKISLSVRLMI